MSKDCNLQPHLPGEPVTSSGDTGRDEARLLDLGLVTVDPETWDSFVRVLDDPAATDGPARVLQAPTAWHE